MRTTSRSYTYGFLADQAFQILQGNPWRIRATFINNTFFQMSIGPTQPPDEFAGPFFAVANVPLIMDMADYGSFMGGAFFVQQGFLSTAVLYVTEILLVP